MLKNFKYPLIALVLGTSAYADIADTTYQGLISKSLFTSNNLHLQTGWYDFDKTNGDTPELSNANFVGSYYFGEMGDKYRPFIQGGFGLSKIEQDDTDLNRGGSLDDIEFDSIYYKIGLGCNFNPYENVGFVLGASAMMMNSDDGNFHPQTPLTNSSYDKKVNKLFNQESDSEIYDVYGSIVYHPTISGYNTQFDATLHYIDMEYDHDIDNIDGFNLDLRAAVHTHELTTLMDLPVWMEFYTAAVLVDSDLSDVVGFDSALSAGLSVHWKVGPMIHIFNDAFKDVDLSANLQGTVSNTDFEGWKASLSFHLLKF